MQLLKVVTPRAADVVTLAEARKHLRFFDASDTSEDDYIQRLIDAAVANIEGPSGMLGRCLLSTQLELTIDQFPWPNYGWYYAKPIKLPFPPIISVDSVKYTYTDGTESIYADYRTFGVGANGGGYIMPALNTEWPTTAVDPGAVRITFTAGYATVPESIKQAILLLVSHMFEHREAVLDTASRSGLIELPMGVERLLNPHRIWAYEPNTDVHNHFYRGSPTWR